MTAAPLAADPLLDELVRLDACLSRVLAAAPQTAEPTRALEMVEVAQRRLAAVRLKVVAAGQVSDSAALAGLPTAASWVARTTRSEPARAAREVALATALERGPAGDTVRALQSGEISTAHAGVIAHALRSLPPRVTPRQRSACEEALVADARDLDPQQLRRRARRVLAEVEPDPEVVDAHEDQQVLVQEDAAYAATSLTFHDNADGTVTGRFTLPHLQAAMLRKAVEALAAPRRTRAVEQRDPAHARGLALATLLEHLPTDRLHGATTAQVVVTMDLTLIQGALKVAGLDTGEALSAREARRLVCGSHLVPAVLGTTLAGASRVLDLGRSARLFNDTQRTAVATTHRHCAARGCDRPVAWCELHHRRAWSLRGATDLENAAPLCHWHHRRVHDPRLRHTWHPDGSLSFSTPDASSVAVPGPPAPSPGQAGPAPRTM